MLSFIPKSVLLLLAKQVFEKVIIPLIRDFAAKTPNRIDDAAVKVLEEVIEYVMTKLTGKV